MLPARALAPVLELLRCVRPLALQRPAQCSRLNSSQPAACLEGGPGTRCGAARAVHRRREPQRCACRTLPAPSIAHCAHAEVLDALLPPLRKLLHARDAGDRAVGVRLACQLFADLARAQAAAETQVCCACAVLTAAQLSAVPLPP